MTTKEVKVAIIRNPKITANDIDFNFDAPQGLGGLKRAITVKRNKLQKLVDSKNYTYPSLSKKLGISVYALQRFLSKETLNPITSKEVYDVLYSNDLDALTIESETERFSGLNKMNIRYLFIKYIIESKKFQGNFFSLPSETCAFENELNIQTTNKFHYVGVEHDKDLFMDALQTLAKFKLKMSLTLGKAKDVLMNAKSEFFTHIFADYCGTFPTFEDEVRTIFTNNLVRRGGLVGLTFNTREAINKNQRTIDFHKSILDELGLKTKPSVVGGIKLKLLSFIGQNYKIVEFVDYNDNGHMVFVLIKRIK